MIAMPANTKISTIMDLASPERADHDVNFMIDAR
jgi:hypothetical protein